MGIMYIISKYFDPGTVEFSEHFMSGQGLIDPKGNITLSYKFPTKEDEITLIHELLHFDPRYFDEEMKCFKSTWMNRDEKIEKAIEKEAKQIVENRPILMEYLKHKLGFKNSYIDRINKQEH